MNELNNSKRILLKKIVIVKCWTECTMVFEMKIEDILL